MNKPPIQALLLAVVCLPAARAWNCAAHDFWVQPKDFWVQPDIVTPVTLQVGHGPYRQRSPISASRITRFDAIDPHGAHLDLRTRLHPRNGPEDGDFRLEEPGTYLLVMETDNKAQSHLPAIRFNDYLQVEGLTPALEQRMRTKRMDADGSECYGRRAKVLMQVGEPSPSTPEPESGPARDLNGARAPQQAITQPVGLPLEIVPDQNPYSEPRPPTLSVHVLYEHRPLPRALVKLTQLEHDSVPFATQLTDTAGRAVFPMPREGTWLLNVIWTKPLPRTRETDFETLFSSLSFGFPARQGAETDPR